MPYNNSAIPPSEEITGAATLPLARVKKILHVDEEISGVSANAAFAITIATEMFIRYLAEQAMNVVKSEKKPRRNIQYKDMANAVSRIDNLQFLEDVVPKTTTYREYKAKKARAAHDAVPLQNGQTTLDGSRSLPQRTAGAVENHAEAMDDIKTSDEAVEEHAAGPARQIEPQNSNGQQYIFEHYEPNGTSRRDDSGDVEMS